MNLVESTKLKGHLVWITCYQARLVNLVLTGCSLFLTLSKFSKLSKWLFSIFLCTNKNITKMKLWTVDFIVEKLFVLQGIFLLQNLWK